MIRNLLFIVLFCAACGSQTPPATISTISPTPTTTEIPSPTATQPLAVQILLGTAVPPRNIEIIFGQESQAFVEVIPVGCRSINPSGEGFSVYINERVIWEIGNNASELQEHIAQNTRFILDDVKTFVVHAMSGLTLNYVMDENYPLGSYGDITFCLETYTVDAGLHTATIELTSLSGVPYSYTWQFTIEDTATQTP